jgi:hypothetical protein
VGKGGVLGDALKGRRLLIAAAVTAAVLAGLGAAAQAGILSRAEAGDTHSRAAGAAIADPQGNGDVIAVAETTATRDDEGNNSASATLLRVGDTKIGEAPEGTVNPLSALNGLPTESTVDMGCDYFDPNGPPAPLCVGLLQSNVTSDSEFGSSGTFIVAQANTPLGPYAVLGSNAVQGECPGHDSAAGVVVANLNDASGIDVSIDQGPLCQTGPA